MGVDNGWSPLPHNANGVALQTFTASATGLDEDVTLTAVLTVRCARCGDEIAWVFDVPDARGAFGPQILLQFDAARQHPLLDPSMPQRVNTAWPAEAGRFVSSIVGSVKTYCGGCRSDRMVPRRELDSALARRAMVIRVKG